MLRISLLLLLPALDLSAADVKVLFDPARMDVGPFPTDYLTAPGTNTKTGRRVRLPQPADCNATPNLCQEVWLLEQFDGFNPQARVSVRFSGPIDPNTLKDGMYLVARENRTTDEAGIHRTGDPIPLNELVYDSETHTASGKPDGPLDQHRTYLLVVTDAVRDAAGDAVEADQGFTNCAGASPPDDYCRALGEAVRSVPEREIRGASVYTTMSVTAWLENARDALESVPASVSNERFVPIFNLVNVVWRRQTELTPAFSDDSPNLPLVQDVRGLFFGSFQSPNYLNEERGIAAFASAGTLDPPLSEETIAFHAFVPWVLKPDSGYPVVIYLHDLNESRFGSVQTVAQSLAAEGMVTVAIDAAGHGFGPQGLLVIEDGSGGRIEIAAPGRGADLNGDGRIEESEGCMQVVPSPIGWRDCVRQTAVDLMQLARVLRNGIDLDGDGSNDIDTSRIHFAGRGFGAMVGTAFMAVDQNVRFAVLNSGGGSLVSARRLSERDRNPLASHLGLRHPALGDGQAFDEDLPLRNHQVRVVATLEAAAIRDVLEMHEWLQAEGDPLHYAAHLQTSPLVQVPPKDVLWQFGWGDRTVPNPAQSALVRHANMPASTWIYRHDLARAVSTRLPADSHDYLVNTAVFAGIIRNAVHRQITTFLTTGSIANPNVGVSVLYGADIFEQPGTLPEELNFLELEP